MEEEIWKPTKYVGYEVSDLGRVRSYWRPRGLFLDKEPRIKSVVINNNRAKVNVHNSSGHNRLILLSRLVAEVFLGEPQGRIVVPRDRDPANCRVDNLFYATNKEAADYLREVRYQLLGDESSLGREMIVRHKREDKLARALRCKQLRNEGKSYREIGKIVGMSESGVCRILLGLHNQLLKKATHG